MSLLAFSRFLDFLVTSCNCLLNRYALCGYLKEPYPDLLSIL
uniref:Uncharacterized protein n=1 Tax=Tetranychus urticae TaxID=32264 RepID=T1JT86_TETUR